MNLQNVPLISLLQACPYRQVPKDTEPCTGHASTHSCDRLSLMNVNKTLLQDVISLSVSQLQPNILIL